STHLFRSRRVGADLLLSRRCNGRFHRPEMGRGTASNGVRHPASKPLHADAALNLCSLRAIDSWSYVPSPRYELVAPRHACGGSFLRACLDRDSGPYRLCPRRSDTSPGRSYALPRDRTTVPWIRSFSNSCRLGP